MKKLLSLLVLWTITIQAATVGIVSGTGSQPIVSLGAGKTPLLTPVGGVDASNNLVPLLVNADGSLQVTGGTGGGGGSGDASASNQVIGNNYLNSIDGKTPALVGGRQPVDGSGVTQPVSGTFWQTTQPVSASALPLPTGAATSANQSTANASLSSIDSKLTGPLAVSGTVTANTGLAQPLTDTQLRATALPVSASALPLPTGAATSALQTTGNTSLSSIDSKMPAAINGAQPVQINSTNFIVSTNNSTVAQLGSGATFTGVIESIFNQQSISVLVTSDQNGILVLKQYIDAGGTKLISSWSYNIVAGVPFSRAFTGNGNFFNLTFQNTGGSATTTLQVDTAYGTLPATTNLGNGNVSLDEMSGVALSVGQKASTSSIPVTLSNENVQDLYVTGQSAQTATVNNILTVASGATATDASGYRSAMVQVVSTGTAGTFIFEGSNDNTNFQTITVYNQGLATGVPIVAAITATASQIGYVFPVNFRYIRLRIATAITGGAIQAFSKFMQTPYSPAVLQVANNSAGNLATSSTIASGTVTTVTTLTTLANGQTAHSAASTGSPLRAGGRVVTALDTTLATGDASDLLITTGQQLVTKDFATSENDWQFTGALTTAVAVAAKAAGAASIRNFVTGISFQNTSATATTVLIQDGATTIAQWNAPASMAMPSVITFPTPLKGTAATALNVNCGTTASNILINVQGYQSF